MNPNVQALKDLFNRRYNNQVFTYITPVQNFQSYCMYPNNVNYVPNYIKHNKPFKTNVIKNQALNAHSHYKRPNETEVLNQLVCKPCDKTFPNLNAYNTHLSHHESCVHPGCIFQATAKVLVEHAENQHNEYAGAGFKEIVVEGKSFRVLLGTNPEEVAQWCNDRKKNFPTLKRKQALLDNVSIVNSCGGVITQEPKPIKRKHLNNSKDDEEVCRMFAKFGKCKRNKNCKFLHIQPTESKSENSKQNSRIGQVGNSNSILNETLLQKLLCESIQSEENIILQIIHHIVNGEAQDVSSVNNLDTSS